MVASLPTKPAPVIRWKLREVMARKKITNRALAKVLDMHEGSISRLKGLDEMPQIDGKTLSKFCQALSCSLFDLIEEVSTNESKRAS